MNDIYCNMKVNVCVCVCVLTCLRAHLHIISYILTILWDEYHLVSNLPSYHSYLDLQICPLSCSCFVVFHQGVSTVFIQITKFCHCIGSWLWNTELQWWDNSQDKRSGNSSSINFQHIFQHTMEGNVCFSCYGDSFSNTTLKIFIKCLFTFTDCIR